MKTQKLLSKTLALDNVNEYCQTVLGTEMSWDFYMHVEILEYITIPLPPPALYLYQHILFKCKLQKNQISVLPKKITWSLSKVKCGKGFY